MVVKVLLITGVLSLSCFLYGVYLIRKAVWWRP